MLVSLKQISELFQRFICVYFTCKQCLSYNTIHNFHKIQLVIMDTVMVATVSSLPINPWRVGLRRRFF